VPDAEACPAAEDRPAERRRREDAEDAAGEAPPARPLRGLGHEPPEKEDGLGAFAEHPRERDEAEDRELARGLRLRHPSLDVAPHGVRVAAHPPAGPGEAADDGEEHGGAEEARTAA